ncbi:MAG: phospho-N-acetylmuramoyl-pentapeptide-transferase [Atribacterota bacterium]
MFRITGSLVIALLGPIFIVPLYIKMQKKYKIGQRIRQEGPDLHQHKTGTPTMGGLVIFFSVGLSLLFYLPEDSNTYMAFILLCSFGLVGFIDDFIKNYKGRSLGLKARVKILIQLIICVFFLFWLFQNQPVSQKIIIPFMENSLFVPQIIYIPFVILVFISSTNAVNLTDGLDGLATGLMIIALIAFALIAFSQGEKSLAIFSLIIGFSCTGFLLYNFHPAKIFLGDVGSLGLGGVLAAIAVLTGTELFLLLIGGVFVIETLSVIIQVISIQMMKKPVFKMSPLHHHFELLKWKETHIVLLFWGVGVVLSFLALAIYPK